MSIAGMAIGELPVGADPTPTASKGKPPRNRITTAKADMMQQPEAR